MKISFHSFFMLPDRVETVPDRAEGRQEIFVLRILLKCLAEEEQ